MRASTRCLVVGVVSFMGSLVWSPRAEAANIQVSYYTPQFYQDYLVFYDQDGKPVYYENDVAYFVPNVYADYNSLVTHFWENAYAYSRWFQEVGYENLNYRLPLAHDGYQPLFYLGFPVFYDDSGLPIYYSAGTRFLVPSSFPGHGGLIRHYRQHRASYLRWYQARGLQFRWYRQPVHTSYYQPLYYDGFIVYYDDSSLPYYFREGRKAYIPKTDGLYNAYISHYQASYARYARWYQSGGNRYQAYRQPVLHRWQVAGDAPRASGGKAVSRIFTPRATALVEAERRSQPLARPEPRPPPLARPEPQPLPLARPAPQPIAGLERRPGARPEPRSEPKPRPAKAFVDCNQEPGHASCQGRGTHQPQGNGQGRAVSRRGENPGRRR